MGCAPRAIGNPRHVKAVRKNLSAALLTSGSTSAAGIRIARNTNWHARRTALVAGCDRPCLTGVLDQYLNAMAANDSKKAPVAANIKYTENAARLPLSEGLWFTAAGLTDYKIVLADPPGSAAAFIGVVTEHMPPGQPPRNTILALRIKVANRQITEAEAVVVRGVNERNMANLRTPRPALLETLTAAQRRPRADLIKISNLYFDAIEQSSGTVAPFDDNCNRLENGMRTAGPPLPGAAQSSPQTKGPGGGGTQRCADGMNSGVFQVITA